MDHSKSSSQTTLPPLSITSAGNECNPPSLNFSNDDINKWARDFMTVCQQYCYLRLTSLFNSLPTTSRIGDIYPFDPVRVQHDQRNSGENLCRQDLELISQKTSLKWLLTNGFPPSSRICIIGVVLDSAKRFHINFQFKHQSNNGYRKPDVAFHFNPRFTEGVVVRNTKINGNWGHEEREGPQVFNRGKFFVLDIYCNEDSFKVIVDGNDYCNYVHRIEPHLITHVAVCGSVNIHTAVYYTQMSNGETGFCRQDLLSQKSLLDSLLIYPSSLETSSGSSLDSAERCSVRSQRSLQSDNNIIDVAFHFNPRFSENVVVRNTKINGNWGHEEREGPQVFSRGSFFVLEIYCWEEAFKVVVNGNDYCYYEHRIKPDLITHVAVGGSVDIHSAVYYTVTFKPSHAEQLYGRDLLLSSQKTPSEWLLIDGFPPSSRICFTGVVSNSAERFHVNLHCDRRFTYCIDKTYDTVFHFNPRFTNSTIVCNSFIDGYWGHEETGPLVFSRGSSFVLYIHCSEDCFKIFVNGTFYCSYKHRMEPHLITHVAVLGCVNIITAVYCSKKIDQRSGKEELSKEDLDLVSQKTPLQWKLTNGFAPSSKICFIGFVLNLGERFFVDFKCIPPVSCADIESSMSVNIPFQPLTRFIENVIVPDRKVDCTQISEKIKVAFHFNPYLIEKLTYFDGYRGHEEQEGSIVFSEGSSFMLDILCSEKTFKVIVNGTDYCYYKHQMDPRLITHVAVAGSVNIKAAVYYSLRRNQYGKEKLHRQDLELGSQKTPLEWLLLNGFPASSRICLTGVVLDSTERFHVDFQCKRQFCSTNSNKTVDHNTELPDHNTKLMKEVVIHKANVDAVLGRKERDVAFHFAPRFLENAVVKNSFINGVWGLELRKGALTFNRGKSFVLDIHCAEDDFKVFINGNLHCCYKHRADPRLIKHVVVGGFIDLHTAIYYSKTHNQVNGKEELQRQDLELISWKTPMEWLLKNGFPPSSRICFTGVVLDSAERFHVDLQYKRPSATISPKYYRNDIAFHFNPRFTEKAIIRNSYIDGYFGDEERTGPLVFQRGCFFILDIYCCKEAFKVLINGKLYCFFEHRVEPDLITHISVNGSVTILTAVYYSKKHYQMNSKEDLSRQDLEVIKQKTSPKWLLVNGFLPSSRICFTGVVLESAERFDVNFLCNSPSFYIHDEFSDESDIDDADILSDISNENSHMIDEERDVAFHFNPRFNEGVIVRNSNIDGSWGPEEQEGLLILSRGGSFELDIYCFEASFQVLVNGKHYCYYKHRIEPHLITHVGVFGSVNIRSAIYYFKKKSNEEEFCKQDLELGSQKTPLEWLLINGFPPSSRICFTGVVLDFAARFHIDFQCETK